MRPAGEVVEDDVEAEPRRDAVDRRVSHRDRREPVACERGERLLGAHLGLGVGVRGRSGAFSSSRSSVPDAPYIEHDEAKTKRRTPAALPLVRGERRVEVDVVRPVVEVADRVVGERRQVDDRVEPSKSAAVTSRTSRCTVAIVRSPRSRSRGRRTCRARRRRVRRRRRSARAPSRCSRDAGDEDPQARSGSERDFGAKNASAYRDAAAHSRPRSRISPRKVSSSNQCLPACVGKCRRTSSSLSATTSSAMGTYRLGRPRSPSHLAPRTRG